MTSQDKIEISLRAAMLAKRIMDLVNPSSKFHAELVLEDAVKQLKELNDKINKLPEE